MKNKRVAYIFDMQIDVDSRTQKEIAALRRSGYEVVIFEWDKNNDYTIHSDKIEIRGEIVNKESIGIKVKKSKGLKENLRFLLKYELALFKWLNRNKDKYDCIHCVNLDTAFVSLICAKLFNKKIVYDVFDDYADAHSCGAFLYRIIKRLDYLVMKRCNYVIICSEKRRKQIIGPLKNLVIIHNSPDIKAIAPKNDYDKFKIAYIGNLISSRMIEDLIDIVRDHPEWELHCGGDGEMADRIRNYSEMYGNIFFYGKMQYEDVIALEAECNLIPAIYDPALKNNTYAAPNKFYEALSLGKPTIMIHNTGMDHLVDKYRLGLTINKSYKELEQAIMSVYKEKEYWNSQRDRIARLYRKNFSWDIMEKRLVGIYDSF